MTTMKKWVALLLAVLMLVSLTVVAGAEGNTVNNSITINNAKSGETYNLYTMFDLEVDNETAPTKYAYKVNSHWANFFGEGGKGAQYITVENGYVTGFTGDDTNSTAESLAKAAAEWVKTQSIQPKSVKVEADTPAVFNNLPHGYHLITSTLGTLAMADTTPDSNAVTIDEKNPVDSIEKKVKEDSTETFDTSNDAQIGDIVKFQSTITLQPYTRNVVVHDKMDAGLSYTAGSIAIEGLTQNTDYTVNENPTDGDTFEIVFGESYLVNLTSQTTLTLTYTATLNENAVKETTGDGTTTATIAIVDQKNTTQITYGDSQSVESQTTTTTRKFTVYKHASGSTDNLAGAVFSLKKEGQVVPLVKLDDNNYRVAKTGETGTTNTFITVATGDIVIWGVDSDSDYTLEEITAPNGYNKLNADEEVTVNADNTTRIEVENKSGAELPSTGGIGTTIFYVAGGVLVLLAVVLLVTKRRMGEGN